MLKHCRASWRGEPCEQPLRSLRIASLFSGCGGLDLGFANAGYSVVYANEYDKTIWDTYELNHPDTPLDRRDIRQVPASDIPDCDGIIGGPPCQSWSAAGLGRGAADARGKLFWEYIRILNEKQPTFFVAENVQGILQQKHRQSLDEILSLFDDAGYTVAYKCLNCADYGVPQDRQRVFFVGYRQDLGRAFDFDSLDKSGAEYASLHWALYNLPIPYQYPDVHPDIPNHEYVHTSFSSQYMSRQRVRDWHEPSFTILASARHVPLHPSCGKMIQISKDIWTFNLESGVPPRRLSVRECARIQTFPDDFKFVYRNIVNGYKMVGNAVPVRMAQLLAEAILEDLVGRD